MPDPQVRIATQLLSGTLYQTQGKTPEQRSEAIELALEVAAEILSKRGRGMPTLDNKPPTEGTASPRMVTKERVIERPVLPPLGGLLTQRRGQGNASPEKTDRKGPTLH